jgi:hypothetical protein
MTMYSIKFVWQDVTGSGKELKALGISNLAQSNAFDAIVGFDTLSMSMRGGGSVYGGQGNKIGIHSSFCGDLGYLFQYSGELLFICRQNHRDTAR